MVKHDTWVKLKPNHPLTEIENLFPKDFPMRDPFAIGKSEDGKIALWYMDMKRLSEEQIQAIAKLYACKFNVDPQTVIDQSPCGFAIDHIWVKSMFGSSENYWRTVELADFLEECPEPNKKDYLEFCNQQYRDWINSDRDVPPMPEDYEDIDPRVKITHGYSRDHRPDLKQFMLNMIVSGDGDVPLFIETGSGNQSDKKVFGEIARKYRKQLKFETTIVADSALYSEPNLKLIKGMSWVTRVPLSIKQAKEIVSNLAAEDLKSSEIEGYSYYSQIFTFSLSKILYFIGMIYSF